ncbi:hypothetical protein H5410_002117, partial [Solanum commersonii]
MVEGMRDELVEILYNNFDELYLYCYYVASTIGGLMSVRIYGHCTQSKRQPCRFRSFLTYVAWTLQKYALGKTIQRMEPLVLTTLKWRMLAYTPCTYIDYFHSAGGSPMKTFFGRVTDEWRIFMKKQIRGRKFFYEAKKGVKELSSRRWP